MLSVLNWESFQTVDAAEKIFLNLTDRQTTHPATARFISPSKRQPIHAVTQLVISRKTVMWLPVFKYYSSGQSGISAQSDSPKEINCLFKHNKKNSFLI